MPKKKSIPKFIEIEGVEIAAEAIADSITRIAESMRALENTRLTRKAIVTLIHEHSRVGKGQIEIVLTNLINLESIWLKKRI